MSQDRDMAAHAVMCATSPQSMAKFRNPHQARASRARNIQRACAFWVQYAVLSKPYPSPISCKTSKEARCRRHRAPGSRADRRTRRGTRADGWLRVRLISAMPLTYTHATRACRQQPGFARSRLRRRTLQWEDTRVRVRSDASGVRCRCRAPCQIQPLLRPASISMPCVHPVLASHLQIYRDDYSKKNQATALRTCRSHKFAAARRCAYAEKSNNTGGSGT
ncbi:hypothetical protein K438DRAFT_2016803 [Mycena galopus ATCC 62051]|nr:hypothetical protein K438DRAFT_2016803 [Mycena galopus ATCC 62051]